MKTHRVPPGASRTINNYRDLGYEFKTALADVLDNSISAKAGRVQITISGRTGNRPACVVITDDGHGMTSDELIHALTFGSNRQYDSRELGKYGLGLKTASLSQCRKLIVASRREKSAGVRTKISRAIWDLDHVNKRNEWEIFLPQAGELSATIEHEIQEHLGRTNGTVVIWQEIDRDAKELDSRNPRKSELNLSELLDELELHLRMVFHKFLEKKVPGSRKLEIVLNGRTLTPWDPYCLSEKTKSLAPKDVKFSRRNKEGKEVNAVVTFEPFILPHKSEFSDLKRWEEASGPDKWHQQQGFYIYRNGRMIQSGGWSNMRPPNEHTKLARIMLDLGPDLDEAFGVNITKMKAQFPQSIREQVRDLALAWAKQAQERYDSKGGNGRPSPGRRQQQDDESDRMEVEVLGVILRPTANGSADIQVQKPREGPTVYSIPHDSRLSRVFVERGGRSGGARKMIAALIAMLRAVGAGKISPGSASVKAAIRKAERSL